MALELKDLNFNFDKSQATYELDALQNELLQFYLRNDEKFRQAFYTDWTPHFIQYMKDKARLHEPLHLSVIGGTRSGKSYGTISISVIHSLLNGREFSIEYLCGNSMEFLDKLKEMPDTELLNSIFQIDEEKKAIYGYGSVAKKMKLTDVQNIIAINNISTISLTPDHWANENAQYGLRSFGRCFKTKTVRFMLYNLQEGSHGGVLPLGMIYLPIFTQLLPKEQGDKLEKDYLSKKNEWVDDERSGRGDVLAELRRRQAENFMRDEQYRGLKKKTEKLTYIVTVLGSQWSKGECEEVYNLAQMLERGITFDK